MGIDLALVGGRTGHLGIAGMRERSAAVGGSLVIGQCPGGGACVVFRWPDPDATAASIPNGSAEDSPT